MRLEANKTMHYFLLNNILEMPLYFDSRSCFADFANLSQSNALQVMSVRFFYSVFQSLHLTKNPL